MSGRALARDDRRITVVVLVVLTLLALVLRLIVMGQSVWGDELYMLNAVRDQSLRETMSIVYRSESTPPLYFVLAWFSAHLGSDDATWIRVPALLFGLGLVPLAYSLGARTVGRRAGLLGAAVIALTPFDVFYGTEGRTYSALAFFSAASTLCLLELVRDGGRRWVLLTAATVAAAAYCHYLAVFVLLAQALWAARVHRERLRLVLLAYAGAIVLYLPWVLGALHQFQGNTSERNDLVKDPLAFGGLVVRSVVGHPFVRLLELPGVLAGVLLLAGVLAGALGALGARRVRPSSRTVLIVVLAAATPVCAALYQLTGSSFAGARYFSASVPALVLAVCAVVTLPRDRRLSVLAAGLFAAGLAVSGVRGVDRDYRRPPYDEVARLLDRRVAPSTPILEVSFTGDPPGRVLGYLFRRPHAYFPVGKPLEEALRLGRRAGRLVVVVPSTGKGFLAFYGLEEQGFRVVARRRLRGSVPLDVLTYEPR